MHAVGHHLRTYAHHNAVAERDAFARSAFNRYYYGCFLLVRSTLIEINVPPNNIKHGKIKEILEGKIAKKLESAKRQAQKNEDGTLVNKIDGGLRAIEPLQRLIEEARQVREVADYKPEIEVSFNSPDGFSLNGLDINSAHRWEETVRTLLASLKSAWRDADD
ncbi:MAG: hypothetical protein INF75_03565 [Roseomonas sp.]|jgi:hypothetical protein|nr:hypothetical protein [Roseomonas sp.]MCA3329178.1 hypothetical protein [Roseomonas sp.]MCA3331085.1 hypothetical protein [Roseomonas sp.]MCA3334917.1 hypothetical protein [Roseomonas sp.]MCA3348464.1 hypothetical protein [Roseomonas sp.]